MRSRIPVVAVVLAVLAVLAPEPAHAALTFEEWMQVVRIGGILTLGSVVAAWRFRKGDGALGIIVWSAAFMAVIAFALYPPPQLTRYF